MFIGHMYSRKVGEWVADIISGPFFSPDKNKWIVIAKVVWRPPFEDIQDETRVLEYESEDGARAVHVGARVGSRTFVGWY